MKDGRIIEYGNKKYLKIRKLPILGVVGSNLVRKSNYNKKLEILKFKN